MTNELGIEVKCENCECWAEKRRHCILAAFQEQCKNFETFMPHHKAYAARIRELKEENGTLISKVEELKGAISKGADFRYISKTDTP